MQHSQALMESLQGNTIFLATNIAESSLTLDRISCVVDCGRAKEKLFDINDVEKLAVNFVSQVD